jgi:hypothetical protein
LQGGMRAPTPPTVRPSSRSDRFCSSPHFTGNLSKQSLRSNEFTAAVTEIERRAERVYEFRKLNDIFVENGVLKTLSVNSNQLLLGRRGVGKTHLVRFLKVT